MRAKCVCTHARQTDVSCCLSGGVGDEACTYPNWLVHVGARPPDANLSRACYKHWRNHLQ